MPSQISMLLNLTIMRKMGYKIVLIISDRGLAILP